MAAEQLTEWDRRRAAVAVAIAEAAASPYRFGSNDCMTLIEAMVRGGGHGPETVEAVKEACGKYHRAGNYIAAMKLAASEHGTVGKAMVEDMNLPHIDANILAGDVMLFEGTVHTADGRTHSTERSGTIEIVCDDLDDMWVWSFEGLRRFEDVFGSGCGELSLVGGIQCLRRSP